MHSQRPLHVLLVIAFGLASLPRLAGVACAEPYDRQHLDKLRAQGQFERAEKYCEEKLAEEQLSPTERADLTIELSRTLAQHALQVPPAEADPLWQQAVRVVDDFAARHPRDPGLLIVRLQGALTLAAQGEAAREASEEASDTQAVEAARDVLRRAIAALRSLDDEVADRLQRPRRGREDPGELSAAQLQSLQTNLRFERARALRNQALAYPAGSADRINALTQAGELLAPLARRQPRTVLVWTAALEEIACLRLLGELPSAEKRLLDLTNEQPPPHAAQQLRAERILLALARGRIDDALAEAGAPELQQASGPDAESARLEALLAAGQRASQRQQTDEAAKWQRRAVEHARAMGRSFGPRWLRRAEARLARAVAESPGAQSGELLAQAAASYYRGGQVEHALATFDQAVGRAREEQQPEQAFRWAYAAAAIERERGRHGEAVARFRALALQSPKEPRAAEAHLLAVHSAAQLAQAQQPPRLDQYEELLREHVATWPGSSTASQAWSWLGRLALHRQDWPEAAAALRNVGGNDEQTAEAVAALDRCYDEWFEDLHQRGQASQRLVDDALADLERWTVSRGRRAAKPSATSRAATLAAARIWLKEVPAGALPAERLLRGALERDPDAPPDWQAAARTLLVPALAAQGKGAQASQVLEQLPRKSAADVVRLLDVLAGVRRRASGDAARKLAALELSVQDELLDRRDELDGETLRAVLRDRAVTLAETGQRRAGIEQLETLARDFPRDGQTHEQLARLLSDGDAAEVRAAVAKWNEVASRSRPGTPRWFRAHHGLARAQLQLGQASAARATIEHVASKHPDFGTPELKRKFDALAAEMEGRPKRAVRGE